jgi:hypothetical protein
MSLLPAETNQAEDTGWRCSGKINRPVCFILTDKVAEIFSCLRIRRTKATKKYGRSIPVVFEPAAAGCCVQNK